MPRASGVPQKQLSCTAALVGGVSGSLGCGCGVEDGKDDEEDGSFRWSVLCGVSEGGKEE